LIKTFKTKKITRTEDIYSDPEVDESAANDDTRSRTETLHSNDFSPTLRSGHRSIKGYFRRKWTKLRKSRCQS
jgi:hypothetical protein